MKIVVVNNAEPADRGFNEPLVAAVSAFAEVELAEYVALPDLQNLENYVDGVIVSGVPVEYGYETIDGRLPYLQWIRETRLPVLGICLGHENIGRLYGAEIFQDEEAEQGSRALTFVGQDSMLDGIHAGDQILTMHRASMSVPADFVLLASTAACRNQLMKHRTRPVYGAQFHPELSETGRKLLANFVRIAAAKKAARNLRGGEEPAVA